MGTKRINPPKVLRTVCASTPLLDALFAQKAAKIELAAGISASSVGSETARLKPVSRPPTGERRWKTAQEWRKNWESCRTHGDRLAVLKEMDEQLGVQVVDRQKVRGTLEWKLRLARDTRPSAIVGKEAGVSPSRVRQLRMDFAAGRLFEKR